MRLLGIDFKIYFWKNYSFTLWENYLFMFIIENVFLDISLSMWCLTYRDWKQTEWSDPVLMYIHVYTFFHIMINNLFFLMTYYIWLRFIVYIYMHARYECDHRQVSRIEHNKKKTRGKLCVCIIFDSQPDQRCHYLRYSFGTCTYLTRKLYAIA